MPLLSASGLEKYYGDRRVLHDVTFQLQQGEKAALIGPNGSGKSTLLKIINGELTPDSGKVHLARRTEIGYLPQAPPLDRKGSLRALLEKPLSELLRSREELALLEGEIARLAREEGESARLGRLMDQYGDLSNRYKDLDGYLVESRIASVSRGLGFSPEDLDRNVGEFSGGEKTRARLAALLLQAPDLLLLDEPTNFLDLDGLEWLERYLRDWPRALVVVSHDRLFLDRVAGRVLALQGGVLKAYPGNYRSYQALVQQEKAALEAAFQKQQDILKREEKLVRESKADERSKRQARSRQKRMAKMERIEKPLEGKNFKPAFDYTGRSGRRVVSMEGIAKSYGPLALFKDLSLEICWGDRVGLVGPNGAGKTTLLRIITGEERPDSGSITVGPAVRVVYFDQEQGRLDPALTVLESVTAASNLDLKQGRNHLGRYLFRGDDVFKQVRELSGGEKCRLALARLALNPGNCLLMDEPTSHLDLASVEELETTLRSYPGTLIIVSHDRYFLGSLVNRVLTLSRGGFSVHEGDFHSYLETRSEAALFVKEVKKSDERESGERNTGREERNRSLERRRLERKLAANRDELEERIAAGEHKIKLLEQLLSDPESYGDSEELARIGVEIENEKKHVSGLLEDWTETVRKLEENSSQ